MMNRPILYSFRRCPYAMRARLALHCADISTEIREILLRDKAPEFLAASPDGTVPLLLTDGGPVAESRDIMLWALARNDPAGWMEMPDSGQALIDLFEGPFKTALDHTKYAIRYPDRDPEAARAAAMAILHAQEDRLTPWLFGDRPRLADMAVLPFVRQFAMIDRARFDAEAGARTRVWLDEFLASARFNAIMTRLPRWQAGDPPTLFPGP